MKNSKDNRQDIIGFDFQGWPVYKQTVRDMLESFGLKLIDGKWQIEDTDPILDVYPLKLNDDGAGYGVNQEYIIEVGAHHADERCNKDFCTIFTEAATENIDIWLKTKFYPYCGITNEDGDDLTGVDVKEEDGEIYILCEFNEEEDEDEIISKDGKPKMKVVKPKRTMWFNHKDLKW